MTKPLAFAAEEAKPNHSSTKPFIRCGNGIWGINMQQATKGTVVLIVLGALLALAGLTMVISGKESGWPAMAFFTAGTAGITFGSGMITVGKQRNFVSTNMALFPGGVTLNSNRTRSAVLACSGACLAVLFGLSILADPSSIAGWLFWGLWFVFFSLGSILLLWTTYKPVTLKLDAQGFELANVRRFQRWKRNEVSDFSVIPVVAKKRKPKKNSKKLIGFDVPDDKVTDRRWKDFIGRNTCFANPISCSNEELVELLNSWRTKAIATSAP